MNGFPDSPEAVALELWRQIRKADGARSRRGDITVRIAPIYSPFMLNACRWSRSGTANSKCRACTEVGAMIWLVRLWIARMLMRLADLLTALARRLATPAL